MKQQEPRMLLTTRKTTRKQYFQEYQKNYSQYLQMWRPSSKHKKKQKKFNDRKQKLQKGLRQFLDIAQKNSPRYFQSFCEPYQESKQLRQNAEKIRKLEGLVRNDKLYVKLLRQYFQIYQKQIQLKKTECEKQASQNQQSKNSFQQILQQNQKSIEKKMQRIKFETWQIQSKTEFYKIRIFKKFKPPTKKQSQPSQSLSQLSNNVKNSQSNNINEIMKPNQQSNGYTQIEKKILNQLKSKYYAEQKPIQIENREPHFINTDILISYIVSQNKLEHVVKTEFQVVEDQQNQKIYFFHKMQRGLQVTQKLFDQLKDRLYWQFFADCWAGFKELDQLNIEHRDFKFQNILCFVLQENVDYNTVQFQDVLNNNWKCIFKLFDFDRNIYLKDSYTPRGEKLPIFDHKKHPNVLKQHSLSQRNNNEGNLLSSLFYIMKRGKNTQIIGSKSQYKKLKEARQLLLLKQKDITQQQWQSFIKLIKQQIQY